MLIGNVVIDNSSRPLKFRRDEEGRFDLEQSYLMHRVMLYLEMSLLA